WRHVLHVELDIVFHTTQPAWRHLCDGGGVVINTASYSALRGIAPLGQAAHAAAKGGVVAMTKTLAAEGAAHGVRANAISPGFVSSPATDAAVDAEGRAWQLSKKLIQRPGTGADIAYLALYLASDESSWVTGQNFSIDGGATAGFRGAATPPPRGRTPARDRGRSAAGRRAPRGGGGRTCTGPSRAARPCACSRSRTRGSSSRRSRRR